MGLNWVWCGICAKYLAFGTYPTSAVGALTIEFCSSSLLLCSICSRKRSATGLVVQHSLLVFFFFLMVTLFASYNNDENQSQY